MADSAGSNPAARTNATVAQLVGGSGFKPRAVSVRIRPVAPSWRSPTVEAAGLNPAQCPFESDRQHGSLSAQPAVTPPTLKQSGGRETFNSSGPTIIESSRFTTIANARQRLLGGASGD